MLESKENYLIESKGTKHVVRKEDGKEFDFKVLYLKADTGIIIPMSVQDYLYEKATPNSKYKLKAILTDRGHLQLNDIELVK